MPYFCGLAFCDQDIIGEIGKRESEQNIDIEVKINGKKRSMRCRVEIVEWGDYEEMRDDRVAVIRHVIKEHEKNWQLMQIGIPTETHIPIMFRERKET